MKDSNNPTTTGDGHGEDSPTRPWALRADTLSEGIVLLIALTVVQRLVGFIRGILFCRWLEPDQLGSWDLAFGFLLLAAPLAVLGLPGTFGRYVEHYRQRGQLRMFLRRTALACAVLSGVGVSAIATAHRSVSWMIFGDAAHGGLIVLLAASLVSVIAFGFCVELFTALRQMRIISGMQFANSLMFALLGTGLVLFWRAAAEAVIVAYAGACLITSLGAVYCLCRVWRSLPATDEACQIAKSPLWQKLLPFAAWVWMTNLVTNLFSIADRYMIMHFGRFDSHEAAELVGNYHSSRVVPLLMIAVAGLLADMLLPHLSHDWEMQRRRAVADRLNLLLKTFGLVLLAGGASVLLLSPVLFGWAFAGKYDGGLAVLPLTLVYCVWFGITLIAQTYLWCAEKARLACLVYLTGLVVNVVLNLVLLPRFGLWGAVAATTAGNAVAMTMVYFLSHRLGMRQDPAVWLISALPVVLVLGTGPAFIALLLVIWACVRGNWVFSRREKSELLGAVERYVPRARRLAVGKQAASN